MTCFYVRHKEDEGTESGLHTPCWYPILFCQMTNKDVREKNVKE